MRRPWFVVGSIVTVITIGWGAFTAVALMAHERTRTPISFTGVTVIRIDNSAGGMTITGIETLVADDTVSGIRRVDRGLMKPRFSERMEGSTLVISAECPAFSTANCSVHYDLNVPRGITLDLNSSTGDLRVSGVDGAITADASAGGIRIEGSAGVVDAHSSAGEVKVLDSRSRIVKAASSAGGVEVTFTEPPSDVIAKSSAGGVDVRLPRGETLYSVTADSSAGGVRVDVRTDPQSPNRIVADSSAGGVTVTYTG